MYHSIDKNGFIFQTVNSNKFTLTTERHVYIYRFNEKMIPVVDVCFYNFMGCSMIMFNREFCTSVKYGTVGISVFRRKYKHSFMAEISNENFDNAIALEIPEQQKYIVAKDNCLRFFQRETFTPVHDIIVPFEVKIIDASNASFLNSSVV